VSVAVHHFYAVAFEENLSLKELGAIFPGGKASSVELHVPCAGGGGLYLYPFGAVVAYDLGDKKREEELKRLFDAVPKLTTQIVREEFTVREDASATTGLSEGVLNLDRVTPGRVHVVALTIAQSAAMEYYETIVDVLVARTMALVQKLQATGRVPFRTRPLNRFIGEAAATHTEVLSVLHLLDKPDATWDDPVMDLIYADLRDEFDLGDRYQALESKLRSAHESLQLVLEVARDRRLFILEAAVVLLILLEIVLSVFRLGH
jgi:required for meiotic nuclear division protein 1